MPSAAPDIARGRGTELDRLIAAAAPDSRVPAATLPVPAPPLPYSGLPCCWTGPDDAPTVPNIAAPPASKPPLPLPLRARGKRWAPPTAIAAENVAGDAADVPPPPLPVEAGRYSAVTELDRPIGGPPPRLDNCWLPPPAPQAAADVALPLRPPAASPCLPRCCCCLTWCWCCQPPVAPLAGERQAMRCLTREPMRASCEDRGEEVQLSGQLQGSRSTATGTFHSVNASEVQAGGGYEHDGEPPPLITSPG